MGDGDTFESTDRCTYSRKMFKGFLFSIVLVVAGVIGGMMLMEPVMATILWAFGDGSLMTFLQPETGGPIWVIDMVLIVTLVVVYGIYKIGDLYDKAKVRAHRRQAEAEEGTGGGFISTSIRDWHDKVCTIVKFDD